MRFLAEADLRRRQVDESALDDVTVAVEDEDVRAPHDHPLLAPALHLQHALFSDVTCERLVIV